jgi:hypothetical protein
VFHPYLKRENNGSLLTPPRAKIEHEQTKA